MARELCEWSTSMIIEVICKEDSYKWYSDDLGSGKYQCPQCKSLNTWWTHDETNEPIYDPETDFEWED